MSLRVETVTGSRLGAALDDVARLRIAVFRGRPYLYEVDPKYEHRYLRIHRDRAGAFLVGAFDGDKLVGAATSTPMEDHSTEFAASVARAGLPLSSAFYFAESVQLPEHRGQGIGHAFFEHREAHVRSLARSHVAFCAVGRPDDHPARPDGYVPLEGFWRRRGYEAVPGAVAEFSWKDLGRDASTKKPLQVWTRAL